MINKEVKVLVGPSFDQVETSVTIIDQIGNGYLGRTKLGKYCSIHHDFCGKLFAHELTNTETEARTQAERDKNWKS